MQCTPLGPATKFFEVAIALDDRGAKIAETWPDAFPSPALSPINLSRRVETRLPLFVILAEILATVGRLARVFVFDLCHHATRNPPLGGLPSP